MRGTQVLLTETRAPNSNSNERSAFGETFVYPNEPSAPAERVLALRNVLVVLHERGLKKR